MLPSCTPLIPPLPLGDSINYEDVTARTPHPPMEEGGEKVGNRKMGVSGRRQGAGESDMGGEGREGERAERADTPILPPATSFNKQTDQVIIKIVILNMADYVVYKAFQNILNYKLCLMTDRA